MLQLYDIDFAEHDHTGAQMVSSKLYPEFTNRANAYIAAECSKTGVMEKGWESKQRWMEVFCELINTQYLAPMNDVLEQSKALFARHGIQFRLHDVSMIMHGWHTVWFMWNINGVEYVFDVMWDSTPNDSFDSLYKICKISVCGEILEGDILHGTCQFFHDGNDLPPWFVDGLRSNS